MAAAPGAPTKVSLGGRERKESTVFLFLVLAPGERSRRKRQTCLQTLVEGLEETVDDAGATPVEVQAQVPGLGLGRGMLSGQYWYDLEPCRDDRSCRLFEGSLEAKEFPAAGWALVPYVCTGSEASAY